MTSVVKLALPGTVCGFTSRHAGACSQGAPAKEGIYRLDVASGDLAYVGSFGYIGDIGGQSYMNPDGSVVVFTSNSPSLNALGGQQNGGTLQYYRYDDRDRSLICISCPADGSPPRGAAAGNSIATPTPGANIVPLSRDGEDFAFPTPISLVPADQNTAGAGQNPKSVGVDIYEWRAGRPPPGKRWPHQVDFRRGPRVRRHHSQRPTTSSSPRPPSTPRTPSTAIAASTTPGSVAASNSLSHPSPARWRSARERQGERPKNRPRGRRPSPWCGQRLEAQSCCLRKAQAQGAQGRKDPLRQARS